jgi:regulator of replication initiation timing
MATPREPFPDFKATLAKDSSAGFKKRIQKAFGEMADYVNDEIVPKIIALEDRNAALEKALDDVKAELAKCTEENKKLRKMLTAEPVSPSAKRRKTDEPQDEEGLKQSMAKLEQVFASQAHRQADELQKTTVRLGAVLRYFGFWY